MGVSSPPSGDRADASSRGTWPRYPPPCPLATTAGAVYTRRTNRTSSTVPPTSIREYRWNSASGGLIDLPSVAALGVREAASARTSRSMLSASSGRRRHPHADRYSRFDAGELERQNRAPQRQKSRPHSGYESVDSARRVISSLVAPTVDSFAAGASAYR